jgi:hypothetical protein
MERALELLVILGGVIAGAVLVAAVIGLGGR